MVNCLSYPEGINEQIYNILQRRTIGALIPLTTEGRANKPKLSCDVTGVMPLQYYYYYEIDKKTFLWIVNSMVNIVEECENNRLDPGNLDLSIERIFYNLKTNEINCILWPVVNNKVASSVSQFFKELPDKFRFVSQEDKQYIKTYKSFFGGFNAFSIVEFKRMLAGLSPVKTDSNANFGKGCYKEPMKEAEISVEYNPFTRISSPKKEKITDGKLCACCGTINSEDSEFCYKCGTYYKTEDAYVRQGDDVFSEITTPEENTDESERIQPADAFETDILVALLAGDRLYDFRISSQSELHIGIDENGNAEIDTAGIRDIAISCDCDGVCVSTSGFLHDKELKAKYDEMILLGYEEKILLIISQYIGFSDKALVLPQNCLISFGRADDNDVVIDLPFVSAHHFILTSQAESVIVSDSSSRNGTYLNGQRINTAVLENGDVLEIFGIRILFENGVLCFENVGESLEIKDKENIMLIV